MSRVNSICLFRLSALGDICMCVPVVRTLQKAFPKARITWVISRPAYDLVEDLGGVDFVVINKPRGPLDYLNLRTRLRRHNSGRPFDVLLAMQASLRANLAYAFIPARRKIGFDRVRARDGQRLFTNETIPFAREHLVDSFLRFAAVAGAPEPVMDFSLPLDQAHRRDAADLVNMSGQPTMLVNACASKAERDWPLDRLITAIQYARQTYQAKVILIGGTSRREAEAARHIQRQCKVTDLVGTTGMKQLVAMVEAADVMLAPDTGPVHIARAMNTPVIGLYAVAPSWLTGPYANMQFCIDHFDDAVRDILGQDPDTIAWKTRVHDARAMQLISVDEVTAMIDKVLGERR